MAQAGAGRGDLNDDKDSVDKLVEFAEVEDVKVVDDRAGVRVAGDVVDVAEERLNAVLTVASVELLAEQEEQRARAEAEEEVVGEQHDLEEPAAHRGAVQERLVKEEHHTEIHDARGERRGNIGQWQTRVPLEGGGIGRVEGLDQRVERAHHVELEVLHGRPPTNDTDDAARVSRPIWPATRGAFDETHLCINQRGPCAPPNRYATTTIVYQYRCFNCV